jgi:hypothetical protein
MGDFGRADPDPMHDEWMPAVGKARAALNKEPVSSFNLTDQEEEMRDRVWRYLVAPHAYDWFGDTAVEYQRTRVTEMSSKPLKTNKYYNWLHSTRFASSRVRYSRLREDVLADISMLPAAFRSICAVLEIDRQRGVATNEIRGLEDKVTASAAARHHENQVVIRWFVRALGNRYDSYSYALDHLLVETPHEEAVAANASLSDLALYVEIADRGDFCISPSGPDHHPKSPGRARYIHSAPSEGPYLK